MHDYPQVVLVMGTSVSRYQSFALLSTVLFVSALAVPTILHAQAQPLKTPVYSASDINDVDLVSGAPNFRLSDVAIGGASPLVHTLMSSGSQIIKRNAARSSAGGYLINCQQNKYILVNGTWIQYPCTNVEFLGESEDFYKVGSAYVTLQKRGSTLTLGADNVFLYTKRDGTVVRFDSNIGSVGSHGPATSAVFPDGRVLNIHYKIASVYLASSGVTKTVARIQSETRSDGFQLKYIYSNNANPTESTLTAWWQPTSIIGINNAFDYCAPTADTCTLSQAWPTATYAWSVPVSGVGTVLTVTDQRGAVTRYTMDSIDRVVGVKWPSSSSADNVTYTYCNSNCYTLNGWDATYYPDMVATVVRGGQTWTYNFAPGQINSFSSYSSTNPAGATKQAQLVPVFAPFTMFVAPVLTISNEDGSSVWYDPTSYTGRINSMTVDGVPESFLYDDRANVTSHTRSGTRTAGYDVTCSNRFTCNQPNWVTDWNGNRTDFTYDPLHGGGLTATGPAVNGIRPQTRYSYTQRYAWVKNSSGSYVRAATPIWVLTRETYCRTTAASGSGCSTASDEVLVNYDYGPDSGPNNLLLRGTAVSADGVTLRTCFRYDVRGNKISETRPKAGLTSCP